MTLSLCELLHLIGLTIPGCRPPGHGTPPPYGEPISSAPTYSDPGATTTFSATSAGYYTTLTVSGSTVTTAVSTLSPSTSTGRSTVLTATLSDGETTTFALPTNLTLSTLPTGSSAISTSESTTTALAESTTVNENGQTVISNSDGMITVPTGLSSAMTIITNGQTLTFVPSTGGAPGTTTDSEGLTVITNSGGAVTIPTGTSIPITTTDSNGSSVTFVPPSDVSESASQGTSTGSTSSPDSISVTDGTTIISNTEGLVTVPTGLTESTVITNSNGDTFTFVPSTSANVTTLSTSATGNASLPGSISVTDGITVISNTNGVITVPTGLTEATTLTNSNGGTFTFVPSSSAPLTAPGNSTNTTTSTNPAGDTTESSSLSSIVSGDSSASTTVVVTTNSDDSTMTFTTDGPVTTPTTTPFPTTDSNGQLTTVTPTSNPPPITTTDANGQPTTISPPVTQPPSTTPESTSTETGGFIVPVTTSVEQPKPTDDGSVIPCDLWFFDLCIRFWDIDIFGWVIDLPPGVYPPGPPPPIIVDPTFPIKFNTIGPMPTWPAFTIGLDRLPTFPPKPSTEPDGGCETQTAEICATTTSYGVSISETATMTTTSAVLSTCATVMGCNVEDSATTATTTSTTSCSATTDLSLETGLCSSGNFPLYDPESNSINCDIADADVPRYLSGCQEDANNFEEFSTDEIECLITCPNESGSNARRDAPFGLPPTPTTLENVASMDAINITRRQDSDSDSDDGAPPPKRPRYCPPPPPPTFPGQVHPGRTECDVVFQCDTDLWPNVCNNARSAQVERAKPTVLAYTGDRQDYVTNQWWRTHAKQGNTREDGPAVVAQRDAGTLPGQPHGGWGLIGCEVEEYPFGNSLTPVAQNLRGIWDNRAVLRLVPWEENRDHGNALGRFIAAAQNGDPSRNLPALTGQWTYCVDVVGSRIDTTNYLLGQDQSANRCGQAYGPGYLLVNDISSGEARQHPNERRWDPWFDDHNQLFEHTIYSSGQVIATTLLPSQYGQRPAPGLKTFIRNGGNDPNAGTWSTAAANGITVGTAVASGVPGARGQNLKYDDPASSHAGIWKRTIDIDDLGYDAHAPSTPLITPAPTPYVQARRPMEQVQAKKVAQPVKRSPVAAKARLLTRAEKFHLKRQSVNSGSYLDARVYRAAFLCPVPEIDKCITQDCWEGGVVYDADGGVAVEGSADQSGPNGEDTGDETLTPSASSTQSSSITEGSTTPIASSSPNMTFSLPPLTQTSGFSTPAGSSCASTAPVTQCNGSGGQSVCVTSSTCASWINTSPTQTPTPTTEPSPTTTASPPAPLFTSPTVCNSEADFPGHADIQSGSQASFADDFCNNHNTDIYGVGPNLSQQYQEYQDSHGVNYEYRITYISGCQPEGWDHQNTYSPQMDGAGITCPILMKAAYSNCNNGGVGGSITVGCLNYEFIGAR